MRLPYVSRVAFEAAIARADSMAKRLQEDRAAHRAEIGALQAEAVSWSGQLRTKAAEYDEALVEIAGLEGDVQDARAEAVKAGQEAERAREESRTNSRESSHIVGMYAALLDEEKRRYNDLLDRYHEATSRTADLAELAIKPAPITVTQPDAKFEDFPPDVAVALAYATQGYKPDEARNIHNWTRAELAAGKHVKDVVRSLREGLPVEIDMEEAH